MQLNKSITLLPVLKYNAALWDHLPVQVIRSIAYFYTSEKPPHLAE